MKNSRTKKLVAILLALLLIPAVPVTASAAGGDAALITITPTKSEYAAGEKIEFNVSVKNMTFGSLRRVELGMTFERPEKAFLVSGNVWGDIDPLSMGYEWQQTFDIFEDEKLVEAGEKYGGFISILIRFFSHLFSYLSPFIRRIGNSFTKTFGDLSWSLANMFNSAVTQTPDPVTVIYDSQEIRCTFSLRYRVTPSCELASGEEIGIGTTPYTIETELTPGKDGACGIAFGADLSSGALNGGIFCVNAADETAGVASVTDGAPTLLAAKYAAPAVGEPVKVKLQFFGDRVKAWILDNPLDEDPYPIFDLPISPEGAGAYVFGSASGTKTGPAEIYEGETYSNPVYPASPDPYILYDEGVYYLYATNDPDGYSASTSTDLVHWTNVGRVAYKDDLIGDYWFWAPEVYKYDGRYYMFYSAQEHLGIAVADSPTGPFVGISDEPLFEFNSIDGHVFFDDDGRKYLYFSAWGENMGQGLFVCELNDDLTGVKRETLKQLSRPQGWEGPVNEGPYMLKHNGIYYLTYSGEGYTSKNYGVAYMTSSSPTGPFTRAGEHPILKSDTFLFGTGHHCFTVSPDGSEMFIAYHCHYSDTQVEMRKLCIDRVKFVPAEDGIDKLVIYGPTVTPQPAPSAGQ